MNTGTREHHLVELVTADGVSTGSTTVDAAHRSPGQLHRAFSVFVRDPAGRVLLQQRSSAKTRFPLRWANTCCGHPAPGSSLARAASQRLVEEIGISDISLREVGVYSYYAEDPVSGRVEYEYDHVLLGDVSDISPSPDPAEVTDLRWVSLADLRAEMAAEPRAFAPWLAGVVERLEQHLENTPEPTGGR